VQLARTLEAVNIGISSPQPIAQLRPIHRDKLPNWAAISSQLPNLAWQPRANMGNRGNPLRELIFAIKLTSHHIKVLPKSPVFAPRNNKKVCRLGLIEHWKLQKQKPPEGGLFAMCWWIRARNAKSHQLGRLVFLAETAKLLLSCPVFVVAGDTPAISSERTISQFQAWRKASHCCLPCRCLDCLYLALHP